VKKSLRTTQTKISQDEFQRQVQPIIGQEVSRVWQGGGSSIFFEIGELTETQFVRRNGTVATSQHGRYTIMVEWYWRIEKPRSIWFGGASSNRMIDNRIKKLVGTEIEEISLVGRLPELNVKLSRSLWLQTFLPKDGYPRWVVFLDEHTPEKRWLCYKHGGLMSEAELKATT
jgi:hypothetical protein